MSIGKVQNNPKQRAQPRTYNFRNVFKRLSKRFEPFSDRLASFSHHFLRLFSVVTVARLLSTSASIDRSNKITQKRFSNKIEKKLFFVTLILHVMRGLKYRLQRIQATQTNKNLQTVEKSQGQLSSRFEDFRTKRIVSAQNFSKERNERKVFKKFEFRKRNSQFFFFVRFQVQPEFRSRRYASPSPCCSSASLSWRRIALFRRVGTYVHGIACTKNACT